MTGRIFFIILVFLPFCFRAQNLVSGHEFIQHGIPEPAYSSMSQWEKPRIPLIEKYEFRTETKDFLWQNQEYMFRISPGTFAERKSRKAYVDQLNERKDYTRMSFIQRKVYDLHKDWLELYRLRERISLQQKLESLFQKRLEFLYSMEGETEKMLQTVKAIAEIRQQIDRTESSLLHLGEFHQIDHRDLDFSELIPLEQLSAFTMTTEPGHSTFQEEELEYEMLLSQKEQKMEKVESRQFFDFLQFRYIGPHTDPFTEKFSIGAGFILPTSGNKKVKLWKMKLEEQELTQKKQLIKERRREENTRFQYQWQEAIEAWNISKKSQEKSRVEMESLIRSAAEHGILAKPEDIREMGLEAEEFRLQNGLDELEKRVDCYALFLEFLFENDLLSDIYTKNHLCIP